MEMTSAAPMPNGSVTSPAGRPVRQGSNLSRGARKARMKNRGSQTCSSDDEDLHSDDNLRPYEEVKVAHHDKKLVGLGLTPDESAISPIMPSSTPQTPKTVQNGGGGGGGGMASRSNSTRSAGRAYSYGSDEEAEARVPLQGRQAVYQPQQQHLPPQQRQTQDLVVYDPPWDHINLDQMRVAQAHRSAQASESDEDNRHALQRYSQASTLPMPPPSFPPPPPPPLEDIPQRSPAPARQRSFGPSVRGNYSDADFRRQAGYPDGDHELENPYMVQNALGAAYTMDGQVRYQATRPAMHRSGSVPSGHGHGMDASDHYMSSGHSDTYPYHCPNLGDGPVIVHSNERQVLTYPPFGVPANVPSGSYPPSQDYHYSKFSTTGSRMKKKLGQRCTWQCTALILLVLCVGLLACTIFFAANYVEEDKVEKDCLTASPSSPPYGNNQYPLSSDDRSNQASIPISPSNSGNGLDGGGLTGQKKSEPPTELLLGKSTQKSVPPGAFWMSQLDQKQDGNVKLNLTVSSDAIVGIYGRRGLPPTHLQFDFFKIIDGSRVGSRSKRSVGNDYFARDTAMVEFMKEGIWFVGVYNDRERFHSVLLTAAPQAMDSDCPENCHGNGECRDRQCHCFPGYKGWDCSQSVCPQLCSGNGVYVRGQCQCNQGWKGMECERIESECAVPNCNGNGHCYNGQCVCYNGYTGSDCGLVDCLVPDCSGHGTCILGECHCFRGYKGRACNVEDKINVTLLCSKSCSGNGHYDVHTERCVCNRHFTGYNCETEICRMECVHGRCENQRCVCNPGWTEFVCNERACDHRCENHGKCVNGTCVCQQGWNGKHCTINGCPGECHGNGQCRSYSDGWRCECNLGWKEPDCKQAMETHCGDRLDNDHDGLVDCLDPDCCSTVMCMKSKYCQASPDPTEILLRKNAPSPTDSFLDKMRFLIEENSVQVDAPRNSFNESQVSVIRGRVETIYGTPLVGVRVGVVTQPLYGFTLTRKEGMFDILVNGGGSVKLEFVRDPFITQTASVLVPWNQIITMDSVVMTTDNNRARVSSGMNCDNLNTNHKHYLLRPVVLSTWQHTQLGACPERSTIIPESQVLQESLEIPGTDVHLVYHSSESSGYMSLIMIQMTPETIPRSLSMVHLRVSVQGVELRKTFEADPNLKYTFAWDRLNSYKQKVYGIVTARVYVGYQYLSCDHIYWETRSATLNGYDMTASHIGGWNLDIHHTYNHQEGILHKGDGTNIYLKEKPKKILNILGNGKRRDLDCKACNGKALDNGLLSPVALASGLDGSLYVGDYNFIRKLSPYREEIASILELSTITTPYRFYMTVSPVDGRLYISDFMSHRVIRVRTMGPVPDLADNYQVVAGNGEECTPGEVDLCGDGGLAVNARLRYPKGIAINKDGVIYVADGANIRKITPDGIISTLIGTQGQPGEWTPMPCDDILPAEKVFLKWPTSLSINPLDDSLYILDHSIILKLTEDFKLVTVAGRPIYCPHQHSSFLPSGVLTDDEQASSIADLVTLVSPKSITFGPHGDLYIVESDTHNINRIRVVTTDGRIHHFAGAKSKCDCREKLCACYRPHETLAAQALFSEPTSVTVTPDGVLHLADSGNLRVFSVVSELPLPIDRHYEVVAPETQELYVFNTYGQHKHTINIHTGQYVYNFTYTVFSSYGRLNIVEDAAHNKIQIKRNYQSQASDIISPSGEQCKLTMDNRHRLHKFQTSKNSSATFTYTTKTGLLESKQDSQGQTFLYHYDEMGRLLLVRQPTGQITSLSTDINTTGSIVRVATGSSQTKVTYLPNGAVVVLFPSNLTVAIETGSHPIMENDNRMHYKRKVIVPGSSTHRLEWRFYLRRGARLGDDRIVEKIGQRMRVGELTPQHVVHDSVGSEGPSKALMINGENLLTVEYDRRRHTETVSDKSLTKIITVVYNSAGLPIQFLPASSHHAMNVSYNREGYITEWQYGELTETRDYLGPGVITERTLKPGGKQYRYFYRTNSSKPTDIFLPSGKQYLFKHDAHGNLESVITPFLGNHYFSTLLSLGIRRFFYKAPSLDLPYIEDYDAMGNLLQIIYPSEERRMLFRYNDLNQRSLVLFDQTSIDLSYHPDAHLLSRAALTARGYSNTLTFGYISTLIEDASVSFPHDARLAGANFRFSYDNNFRQVETILTITNNMSCRSNRTYSKDNGKLSHLAGINIEWVTQAKQVLSNSDMTLVRQFDGYGKLTDIELKFSGVLKLKMQIDYDKIGHIHEWKQQLERESEVAIEYIYDVDSHVTDVLVQGKTVWELGYDADGNINKISSQGITRHIEFDVGDKITMMGGVSYKYDSDGIMAQRGVDHLTFNSAGQLTSITRHGQYEFTYSYDALGRLAVQTDRNHKIIQFFYGDTKFPNLITHVYNHTKGELTEYFRDTSGALIGLQRNGMFYYIVVDPTQSPILVFDKTGNIQKQISYNPLGQRETDSNLWFELSFGFQGGLYNPITELVHFSDRVYDVKLGRFLTPDFNKVFKKLHEVTKDPEVLNLYGHRFVVNTHLQTRNYPRLDLSDWLDILGYDIRSMSPDVTYTGDLNPGPSKPNMQLLPASSAFECTFRRDMHNLLTISTVPKSKVTPLQPLSVETPSPLPSLFGQGVTISDFEGKAIVNIVDVAESWAKKLATVLLNTSEILPIHFTIHGRDVHYFIKPNISQAVDDLRELGIHSEMVTYESGINVSRHRFQNGHVDVRIHSNHTVLNIRYGTTKEREIRRVLQHAKDRAVEHAWEREKYLLKNHLPSSYHWTETERTMIISAGSLPGYVADYYKQPDEYPELADDSNNIRFVATVP